MIGARIERLEDEALLRGRGRFVDDLQLPGMAQAAFLRSPHAHARIRGIDLSAARAMPGVLAAWAFAEVRPHLAADRLVVALPSKAFRQNLDRPVLAIDEATYVGEPVAVVIAESRLLAEDALAAIEVDYEPLAPVVDLEAALAPGAPCAHSGAPHNVVAEFDLRFGDVEAAFAGAAHVFAETLRPSRGGSHSIECRGNVARHDPAQDLLTMWSSTQTPHSAMRLLAEMLGREERSIRVLTPDVGGGFGPKLVFYSEELLVALAALRLGRPVKWIESRSEHFVSTTQEREQVWRLEVAADADGRVRGIRGRMLHDHGAYTARGVNVAFEAMQALTMPYDIPACAIDVTMLATNKVPVTPVRGAGQPQGVFAMERLLDRVARELALDRAEVRRRNLIPANRMPYAKPYKTRGGVPVVLDTGDLPGCQRLALEAAGWADFPRRKAEAAAQGRRLGIGVANFVELTGRGPFEPATVRITSSGRIHVSSSAAAMGQGLHTLLAQVVAAELGGDLGNVDVTSGDSASSTTGFGGFGSRQTVTAGSSARLAAIKVREKALAVAGHLLECAPADLEIRGREICLRGAPGMKVSLGAVARASLGVAGAYLPAGLPPGMEASEAFVVNEMTYSNGTAVAAVEVDEETGTVRVLDFVLAHDCGTAINPMIVDGQVMGGIVHGLGNALREKMVYDAAGQPLTGSFMDYALPIAADVPALRLAHMASPTPLNPLGAKGVGEAGALPTPAAVAAAIEDALEDLCVRIDRAPVTAAWLRQHIAQRKAEQGR